MRLDSSWDPNRRLRPHPCRRSHARLSRTQRKERPLLLWTGQAAIHPKQPEDARFFETHFRSPISVSHDWLELQTRTHLLKRFTRLSKHRSIVVECFNEQTCVQTAHKNSKMILDSVVRPDSRCSVHVSLKNFKTRHTVKSQSHCRATTPPPTTTTRRWPLDAMLLTVAAIPVSKEAFGAPPASRNEPPSLITN